MAEIRIFKTPENLYSEAIAIFLSAGTEAQRNQASFSVALSGGSTPLPLYQRLAENGKGDQLNWEKIHFFWGDERAVGPDHPDSNYGEAFQALLKPRGVPDPNIHRIEGERQPENAAQKYEQDLLEWFGEIPPRFDLILLGLGDDGHTASLFPGTKLSGSAWVNAIHVPKLESWRITMSPRLINAASLVLFLVIGAEKARALNKVLNGPYHPEIYPAQLIQPENGELIWLIDKDAAAELDS
jgi:6-phosphogluconolactonase